MVIGLIELTAEVDPIATARNMLRPFSEWTLPMVSYSDTYKIPGPLSCQSAKTERSTISAGKIGKLT
jgi:hypothetical protein